MNSNEVFVQLADRVDDDTVCDMDDKGRVMACFSNGTSVTIDPRTKNIYAMSPRSNRVVYREFPRGERPMDWEYVALALQAVTLVP